MINKLHFTAKPLRSEADAQ